MPHKCVKCSKWSTQPRCVHTALALLQLSRSLPDEALHVGNMHFCAVCLFRIFH